MPADFKSHVFQALINSWVFIRYLAPYIFGGIVLAAVLNTFVSREKLAKLLMVKKWWMLPVSGLLGLVSPACTYGTVPIFLGMIRSGAPMAPAATFLVASALVNPQMFLLYAGALGVRVAIAQAAASLVFSVGVGIVVARLARKGIDLEGSQIKGARKLQDEHDAHSHHKHEMMKSRGWGYRLGMNMLDLTEFVGFYFVIGTLLAAFLMEFIPSGLVISAVGQGKWWAIPLATVVSIPTYVCGGGTIPFLAMAHRMGMSMGAILAFIIAGPATRITALAALATLFKKRVVFIYLIALLVFATALGFALGGMVEVSEANFVPPY